MVIDVPYSPAQYGDVLEEVTDRTYSVYIMDPNNGGNSETLYFSSKNEICDWFWQYDIDFERASKFPDRIYFSDGTSWYLQVKALDSYTRVESHYGLIQPEQPEQSHVEHVLVTPEQKEVGHWEYTCGY